MQQQFDTLVAKAKENKELLIKIGCTLGGMVLGAGLVVAVSAIREAQSSQTWTEEFLDLTKTEETVEA